LAAIETSAREFAMRGETDRAALLREASTTLRVVMRPDALRRAEPDVAALMEAEGIAMRPGPRPVIAPARDVRVHVWQCLVGVTVLAAQAGRLLRLRFQWRIARWIGRSRQGPARCSRDAKRRAAVRLNMPRDSRTRSDAEGAMSSSPHAIA
jgi:hypothetical protein